MLDGWRPDQLEKPGHGPGVSNRSGLARINRELKTKKGKANGEPEVS